MSCGFHRRDFRHVQLGIIEQREFKRPADGLHSGFRKDQLGDALPLAAKLSFLAHAGHVIDRLADRAQRAAVLVGRGWSSFLDRYAGRNNMTYK